ncbi:hypothetical protein [Kocuria palustris]|uniref:hypothetical protein n=1 Tax=Kocuria palustris TaxID=71999 RepID=UPI0021A8D77F|nr:hypothetical protein [Kocuria palustris]MCT1589955.1 hypothetical protein [Kocuria palustris]
MPAESSPSIPPARSGTASSAAGRQPGGMDALAWATVVLAVSSGAALAAMLITKWIVGGGEIWPWFTRYALVAFPLSVVLLFVLLVRNAIRRARS